MYNISDRKYLTMEEQKTFDEIAPTITTENTFQVNNNKIFTSPSPITNITFGGGLATITTFFPHNLSNGDSVTISGVANNLVPNINTTFAVTTVNATTFTIPYVFLSGIYTAGSGQFTFSKLVADYMHFYAVKCKYIEPQFGLWVTNTANASPIRITFNQRNKFRDKSIIQLSSMTGTPAANGTWHYKQLTTLTGELYQNEDLTIKSTGGVTSNISQGAINYVWIRDAKPRFSDRNIDPYQIGTPEMPEFENADKFLKFYPLNRTCTEINLAYFKIPVVLPDANNNTLNLTAYYPDKFLYLVGDVAIRVFSIPARDILLNQEATAEIQSNP